MDDDQSGDRRERHLKTGSQQALRVEQQYASSNPSDQPQRQGVAVQENADQHSDRHQKGALRWRSAPASMRYPPAHTIARTAAIFFAGQRSATIGTSANAARNAKNTVPATKPLCRPEIAADAADPVARGFPARPDLCQSEFSPSKAPLRLRVSKPKPHRWLALPDAPARFEPGERQEFRNRVTTCVSKWQPPRTVPPGA